MALADVCGLSYLHKNLAASSSRDENNLNLGHFGSEKAKLNFELPFNVDVSIALSPVYLI